MSEKLWLNKKEVCERLGGVNYGAIDALIGRKGFPLPVNLIGNGRKKFYVPQIEKWERKLIKNSIKNNQ